MTQHRNVLLGAESLEAGSGGISRVARLMAKVLTEQSEQGRLAADGVALTNTLAPSDLRLPVRVANKSRLRFCFDIYRAALSHTHFIYDFLGMSRAHCIIPGLERPFMTFIHGIEIWEDCRPDRLYWAKRASILLSNSRFTATKADRLHGGFAKARVCWLATEADEAPLPSDARSKGPPTVLLCGRAQDRYKGHDALIRAWPTVVAAVPDARLVIVGKGSQALRPLADQHRGDRIEILGFVSEETLDQIFARARVFAMPSRGEGFGLVYIEAMRHGIPVIGSIHDAAPEINLDGETGYNINLDDSNQLPERIIHLLRNPDHAAQLGAAGRQRWRAHFRFSAFRERFVPLVNELLAIEHVRH